MFYIHISFIIKSHDDANVSNSILLEVLNCCTANCQVLKSLVPEHAKTKASHSSDAALGNATGMQPPVAK